MKTRAIRRSEAVARQEAAKKRTPREQWTRLNERPGDSFRERVKLEKKDPTVCLELAG